LAARRALADPARTSLAAALAGALTSLFVVMKSNPAPFECLALGAICAGFLGRAGKTQLGPRHSSAAAAAFAAAALALSAATARLWAADRQMRLAQANQQTGNFDGALGFYIKGIDLNPGELTYRVQFINFLNAAAKTAPSHDIQLAVADRARLIGEGAVSWHPNISTSHYALGAAALLQARLGEGGALDVAERELDAALALDPRLGSLLQARLDAAQRRGNPDQIAELERRLAALKAL
jgi:tetratricopeptide (TPR) repeat protein